MHSRKKQNAYCFPGQISICQAFKGSVKVNIFYKIKISLSLLQEEKNRKRNIIFAFGVRMAVQKV